MIEFYPSYESHSGTHNSKRSIAEELKGVIFLNPLNRGDDDEVRPKYLPADEYLSGNIREKLEWARRSAELYPEDYTVNVQALEQVMPKDRSVNVQPLIYRELNESGIIVSTAATKRIHRGRVYYAAEHFLLPTHENLSAADRSV